MIKVLHIITDTNIGGAGRHLLTLLKYRTRTDFDVRVVVPRGSLLCPELDSMGIPVTEVDGIGETSLSLGGIFSLVRVIRGSGCHLVHTHGSASGRIAARLTGRKIVYTRHSVFPVDPRLTRGLPRLLYGGVQMLLADGIIAVADAAMDNLTDCGVRPDRVTVILNGVQPQEPISAEALARQKARYGIEDGCFTAGILARLEPDKGHPCILEAAEKLKAEGRKFRILIAGSGSREAALRQMTAQKGLEDVVVFTGFHQRVNEFLSLLDVQLNASVGTEASSLALMEGMSLGIPTIASDYGGNPQVILHGENGYIFPRQDSDALAGYIARLMDEPHTRQRMGQCTLRHFEERFHGRIFAQNTETVYRGLTEDIR